MTSGKVVAIIQARAGSSRLPGKVLRPLAGVPMLMRVINRVRRAASIDETAVATTDQAVDDEIAELCAAEKVPVYRGSEDDVLDRYYGAACACKADVVVRITSDCPFSDPGLIDAVVGALPADATGLDYCSNVQPQRHYPRGLDVEAFTRAALEYAWRNDRDPALREHVTPYMYRHPERYRMYSVVDAEDHSGHRWTVDTQEDFALASTIYDHFGHDHFTWHEVLDLVQRRPEISALNRHVRQRDLQPTV